jgi:hypothetical protein
MSAYRPDRPGRGGTPAARRRARRRALTGVDPAAPTPPKKIARSKAPPQNRGGSPAPEDPGPEREGRPWFEWRGWDSIITYVVLAVMLAGVITGLHRLLAAGVLVIGVSALAWAVTHRPGQRRTTSGYGVLLDWLMNVLPRALYLIVFVVVTALGAIGVIVG